MKILKRTGLTEETPIFSGKTVRIILDNHEDMGFEIYEGSQGLEIRSYCDNIPVSILKVTPGASNRIIVTAHRI
jgi:hypothetical protein